MHLISLLLSFTKNVLKVVSVEEIAKNDYNVSPSRYIEAGTITEHRDVQMLLNELGTLEGDAKKINEELKGIFTGLGYQYGDASTK